MTKVHKLTAMVIDYDDLGAEEIVRNFIILRSLITACNQKSPK